MVNLGEQQCGARVDLPVLRFRAFAGATVDGAAEDGDVDEDDERGKLPLELFWSLLTYRTTYLFLFGV